MLDGANTTLKTLKDFEPNRLMAATVFIIAIGAVTLMGFQIWNTWQQQGGDHAAIIDQLGAIKQGVQLGAISNNYANCMYFAEGDAASKAECRKDYQRLLQKWEITIQVRQ